MEKILDFKKSKIQDADERFYRFQCECLDAGDAMDIDVTFYDKTSKKKYIIICMNILERRFFDRIKFIFQMLFKGNWSWREFVVREEDLKNLSNIFDPSKGKKDLP